MQHKMPLLVRLLRHWLPPRRLEDAGETVFKKFRAKKGEIV
jgi:hypothetical protein